MKDCSRAHDATQIYKRAVLGALDQTLRRTRDVSPPLGNGVKSLFASVTTIDLKVQTPPGKELRLLRDDGRGNVGKKLSGNSEM